MLGDLATLDLAPIIRQRAIDLVFHLAGNSYVPPSIDDPISDLAQNAAMTLSVLEALRHLAAPPLLVFVSSAAVYGDCQRVPMDEDHPLRPVSPYGISKLAAEQYVSLYSALHRVPSIVVRPFSLYGPGQYKQVVYDLLGRAFGGSVALEVRGSPEVARDFVFVADVAQALVGLARRAAGQGEVYNLASGQSTTLRALAETLLHVTGLALPLRFTGKVREGDPLRWVGGVEKSRALGVRCSTPLEDGLRQTAQWFLASGTQGAPAEEPDPESTGQVVTSPNEEARPDD
ncbi:MAG: SDR family oxidoreductase [Actinomycetota bacterium]